MKLIELLAKYRNVELTEEHNEGVIDWSNSQEKWMLTYDHEQEYVRPNCYFTSQCNEVFFKSLDIAKKAIETIGEDRLKKYYFEVVES